MYDADQICAAYVSTANFTNFKGRCTVYILQTYVSPVEFGSVDARKSEYGITFNDNPAL